MSLTPGIAPSETRARRVSSSISDSLRTSSFQPARLARRALHFDDRLVDLRHFLLEELDQHAGMGARQHDLRAAAGHFDADDVAADAVPLAVALARHLLFFRQDRVGLAQVDDDVFL